MKATQEKLKKMYHEAQSLIQSKSYDEAIRILTQAAEGGYNQAMLTLGSMYYWGKGVEPDTDKAIYWLKKDADMGSHSACLNLAHAYYELGDTEENNRLAWKYYFKAASLDERDLFYLGRMIYEKRIDFETVKQQIEQLIGVEYEDLLFIDSLAAGEADSALYIWKMYQEADADLAEEYYRNGEKLLKTPKDYNNWAWQLCEWGEYEKALPYIEKCLSMEEQGKEHPNHLDTYAECLYGLGRKQDAERTFGMVMIAYQERDERRRLHDTWEKMKQKYSDSVSFRISIPQMERIYGLTKE